MMAESADLSYLSRIRNKIKRRDVFQKEKLRKNKEKKERRRKRKRDEDVLGNEVGELTVVDYLIDAFQFHWFQFQLNRPLHGFRRHLGCGAVAEKLQQMYGILFNCQRR